VHLLSYVLNDIISVDKDVHVTAGVFSVSTVCIMLIEHYAKKTQILDAGVACDIFSALTVLCS
jgi:hypothetical protein